MVAQTIPTRHKITSAELPGLLELPENHGRDFELIDGDLIAMSPAGMLASMITANITELLGRFVRENSLGYVTSAEGGYVLSAHSTVAPDVGFIAKARVSAFSGDYFPGAPDLAVEVLSKTDSKRKLRQKAELYIASGTRIVWVVFPEERVVEVYAGDAEVQTVTLDGTLDGGEVVPGLALAVKDCFPS